ncbi:hypothetical protein [Haladaptatus sp. DFWS20]
MIQRTHPDASSTDSTDATKTLTSLLLLLVGLLLVSAIGPAVA